MLSIVSQHSFRAVFFAIFPLAEQVSSPVKKSEDARKAVEQGHLYGLQARPAQPARAHGAAQAGRLLQPQRGRLLPGQTMRLCLQGQEDHGDAWRQAQQDACDLGQGDACPRQQWDGEGKVQQQPPCQSHRTSHTSDVVPVPSVSNTAAAPPPSPAACCL